MSDTTKVTTSNTWSSGQTFAVAAFCLVIGLCGGWLLRKAVGGPTPVPNAVAQAPQGMPPQVTDTAGPMVAPLLTQLQSDPKNAALLIEVGNIYYDAKQYPNAITYYERALEVQPDNTSVRTDMGTAYWYVGDADSAIAEFNKALSTEPNKADTLFNLGIVKMQGKKDAPGAIAAWQKLLDTNPGYQAKDRVLQLIADAKKR